MGLVGHGDTTTAAPNAHRMPNTQSLVDKPSGIALNQNHRRNEVTNLNLLIDLAKKRHTAEIDFQKEFEKLWNDVSLLEADQFWTFVAVLTGKVQRYRFRYGRRMRDATDELFRSAWCNELEWDYSPYAPTTVDCVSFAKTYSGLTRKLYDPLFDVVKGYSDDAYGDLLDTLPLLGREFVAAILAGTWDNHNEFFKAMGHIVQKDWKFDGADQFFLHGEEYVSMSLRDSAEKYLYYDLRQREPKAEEHQFV